LRQIVEDCTATHDAALFFRCKFERHKASPLVHPSKKHGGGKPRQAQAALLQCRLQTSLQQYLQSSCRVLQHVVVISVLGVGCFGRGDASVRSHTKTLSNVACVLASNVMRSIQEFHCINDGKHEMRLELEALTTAVCGMCVYSAAVWATDLAATMSAAKPCRGTASGVSSIIQLLQQAMQFEEFKAVRSNPAQAFACAIVCIMNVLLVKDVQVCMDVAMLTNMYGMATKCVAKLRSGGSPFLEACSATLHVMSAALRGVDGDGTDGGKSAASNRNSGRGPNPRPQQLPIPKFPCCNAYNSRVVLAHIFHGSRSRNCTKMPAGFGLCHARHHGTGAGAAATALGVHREWVPGLGHHRGALCV
jgi:hypothetical protein